MWYEKWYDDRLCSLETTHLFFDITDNGRYIHLSEAMSMCAECPVQVQCADDAMKDTFRRGIWGKTTEGIRHNLRAQYRADSEAFYSSISPAIESVSLDVEEETMRRLQGIL